MLPVRFIVIKNKTCVVKNRVPTAQGIQEIQGKWPKKIPVRENSGNLEILPKHRENTGNLVCSSCKFPDSKGKSYSKFAAEISNFCLSLIRLPNQFCVCNSHKSRKLTRKICCLTGKIQGQHREFENAI